MEIDPICLMKVSDSSDLNNEYEGKKYFFCSTHCLNEFSANPTKYIENTHFKPKDSDFKNFYPLILVFIYLIGMIFLVEFRNGGLLAQRMMANFMGGFFVVFSFFKFLDLKGFSDAFRTYDIVAKRFPVYGLVYPFVEVSLGISYLLETFSFFTNLITSVVMFVSSLGVLQSLLKKKSIQCACLGVIFKLPMSKITLVEDVLMLGMSIVGLICLY